jgi:lipid II:glycine glycyltransferase (peptidoglycan interpeptide bridge formation enzyme)
VSVRRLDRDEWIRLAQGFRDRNYRQAWAFGAACAERVGAASEHVAVERAGEVIALADVRVKQAPLVGGVAYITGAPMVRRGDGYDAAQARLDAALDALRERYVRERGLTLRVLPHIGDDDWTARQAQSFERAGFGASDASRPYHTMVVDIRPDEDAIRKSLAQKWRNCLNASERNGLTVTIGDEPERFARFATLFEDLLDRKGFETDLDCDFYAALQPHLDASERFVVTLVEADGELAAGHVGHIAGDTCVYILGAANDAGRKTKAAYLVQWAFLLAGKAAGCDWYDLGGVDAEENPGVYKFKKGLGGPEVSAPGPFELRPDGVRGAVTAAAERAYKAAKRLKARRAAGGAST